MRLVAFDFDGTLSDTEMVVLLGEQAGCMDEITGITDRAMAGELGYAESLRERVALLEGLSEAEVEAAYDGVWLREGVADLLRALSGAGVTTGIITGGFEAGVARALERDGAPVDAVVANRLVVENGRLTGDVAGPLVEGTKDEALRTLAEDHGIDPAETVAVGDGANDVPMLDAAGTAIGFQPKPAVRDHCDVVVETVPRLGEALEEIGLL